MKKSQGREKKTATVVSHHFSSDVSLAPRETEGGEGEREKGGKGSSSILHVILEEGVFREGGGREGEGKF